MRQVVIEHEWPGRRSGDGLTRVKLSPALAHEFMLNYASTTGGELSTDDMAIGCAGSYEIRMRRPIAVVLDLVHPVGPGGRLGGKGGNAGVIAAAIHASEATTTPRERRAKARCVPGLKTFDPTAEETLFIPRLKGG
jgi:hypothetical protein